jgi:hypothetical protein
VWHAADHDKGHDRPSAVPVISSFWAPYCSALVPDIRHERVKKDAVRRMSALHDVNKKYMQNFEI